MYPRRLFRAANLHALAFLHGLHKRRRPVQALARAQVQPGKAPAQSMDPQLSAGRNHTCERILVCALFRSIQPRNDTGLSITFASVTCSLPASFPFGFGNRAIMRTGPNCTLPVYGRLPHSHGATGPIGLLVLVQQGKWPPKPLWLCVTNDFIWWIPFGSCLFDLRSLQPHSGKDIAPVGS